MSPTLQVDSLPSEPPGKPKNTGVGRLSLLQEIFPTQELNRRLLHCRWILSQLSYQGSPLWSMEQLKLETIGVKRLIEEFINLDFFWTGLLYMSLALLCSYQLTSGYKPAPMDLSFIKLTPSQEAMVDKLAENAHNVWARDRIRQGWTYGIQQVCGTFALQHML